MKEVYFTLPSKRSVPTIRIEYGQVKKNFIVRTFNGGINNKSTSYDSQKEDVFENEDEMLKKVNEIKKELLESRWVLKNRDPIPKYSFLNTGIVNGTISFEFSINLDPVKLDLRKKKITKDFVNNLNKEIKKNIRKEVNK